MRRLILTAVCAVALSSTAQAAPVIWVDDASNAIGTVDVATGVYTPVGNAGLPAGQGSLTDLAFSPTQQLYGINFSNLYSISTATGAATLIGATGSSAPVNGLVFGTDGTLYASGGANLYRIDVATGASTLIGSTGLAYASAGDLAFLGGTLYETAVNTSGPASSYLLKVDPTNGAGTLIGTIVPDGLMYGLVDGGGTLYGVDSRTIYTIDPVTGLGTALQTYAAAGLLGANGAAIPTEALPVSAVPEPGTYALVLAGLGCLGWIARRRRR